MRRGGESEDKPRRAGLLRGGNTAEAVPLRSWSKASRSDGDGDASRRGRDGEEARVTVNGGGDGNVGAPVTDPTR